MSVKKVHKFDIVRHGDRLVVPEKVPLESIINTLNKELKRLEDPVSISDSIDAFPWDGAIALHEGIEEVMGWAIPEVIRKQTFFGEIVKPPTMITIETGIGETRQIVWGRFALPGFEGGWLHPIVLRTEKRGPIKFGIVGEVKGKYEPTVKRIIEATHRIAASKSIYRGRAIEIKFTDDDDELRDLPTPRFLDTRGITPIFNDALERDIDVHILDSIRYSDRFRSEGESLKRGILLAGVYGTGKTLVANHIARVATQHNWTYIYVPKTIELPDAWHFARNFQPAVIVAEDVDQVAHTRDAETNKIMNILDGVDSKGAEIMTILTTNHAERIHPGMHRPGRIDVTIEVEPPSAATCERLIRHFAGETLVVGANLKAAGQILEGQIPAVVHEAVKAAKRYAINRTNGESCTLDGIDIAAAAEKIIAQQDFIRKEKGKPDPRSTTQKFADGIMDSILNNPKMHNEVKSLSNRIKTLEEELG